MKKIVFSLIFIALVSVASSFAGNFGFGISGSGSGNSDTYPTGTTTDDDYSIGFYGIIKLDETLRIEPGFFFGNDIEKDANGLDAGIAADRTVSRFGLNTTVFTTPIQNGPVSVLIGGDIGFYTYGSPSDETTYKRDFSVWFISVPLAVELAVTEMISVRISQSLAGASSRFETRTYTVSGDKINDNRAAYYFTNGWAPTFSVNFTF